MSRLRATPALRLQWRARRKIEAWLILLAAKILIDRNVQRSAVVSRRDNNDMWAMAEKLEAIAKRFSKKYP